MSAELRASDTTQTHDGNAKDLKVEDAKAGLENHQKSMMLIDTDDLESMKTHSQADPKMPGSAKKAPTTARAAVKPVPAPVSKTAKSVKANGAMSEPLVDKEVPAGGPDDTVSIALIDNETDPATGYLEEESGLPVIQNASLEDGMEEDGGEFELPIDPEMVDAPAAVGGDEIESSDEFDDMPALGVGELEDEDGDEFEDFGAPAAPEAGTPIEDVSAAPAPAIDEMAEPAAAFETDPVSNEQVPLLDADEVSDTEGADDLAFATVANVVHVIRSNRIIASMGPAAARKLGLSDVYMTEQYQDVIAHAIDTKGLRKGLVQQGLTLAKVKMTASKASAQVVKAKVEAGMAAKMEALATKDKAMEQSLAIAAVGINKKYFKAADNSLKAALVEELKNAGVKGATTLVSNVFAEHGISYARSILTLANKIAAMPEEVRNLHADSLDMTSDEDFEDDVDSDVDSAGDGDDEFSPIASTVTAALASPSFRRSNGSQLTASASAAHALLLSDQPLV